MEPYRSYDVADPFPLSQYAVRAADSLAAFAREIRVMDMTVRKWAKQNLCPWDVYQYAVSKWGPLDIPTPPRVRRKHPFRLPAHIRSVTPAAIATPLPTESDMPKTLADLLLATAIHVEAERNRFRTVLQSLENRIAELEGQLRASYEPPAPLQPAPAPRPAPKPVRQTLDESARKIGVLVTNRAEKEWENFPAYERERLLEIFVRTFSSKEWHRHVVKAPSPVATMFKADTVWTLRVGKHRVLVAQNGPILRVVKVTNRSDKVLFKSE